MTTEELKAHRRTICEALIDGKQCQINVSGLWCDQPQETVGCYLFSKAWNPEFIRIKPEPAKLWVGFSKGNSEDSHWISTIDPSKFDDDFRLKYHWKLVEEDKQ